jgi:glycosyltransferase involved in cell wall biosynthesis
MTLPGRRIWYCNEPPRSLFPQETSPWGMAALGRLGPSRPPLEMLSGDILRREKGLRRHEQIRKEHLEAIPRLDSYMFNSQFIRGVTESLFGPMRGDVLYPTIEFPAPRIFSRRMDRGALKILVQTRLTAFKNVETILEGFQLFAKSNPGAELHIVGTGPSRPSLEAMAPRRGKANITFHGFLSDADLEALRDRCHIYALLPLDEPFGMVFPEAAAQGLLLVGPDHGGPNEIMEEGRLGWPCDALSPKAVCDAFESICSCPEAELEARRLQADQSCRARFAPSVQGPRLLKLLRENT